ncbi:hypothetical protein GF345_00235 [Candidatus Woesearchaeota archaeon]|nr:hypothetical protein [Candidatus Woesearchaeota archaeon]
MVKHMDEYDLELDRALSEIKKQNAKKVCIQLPDGLKPKAKQIADYLNENTKAEIIIWLGTCFGACDIPNLGSISPDLLIQWGHSAWNS